MQNTVYIRFLSKLLTISHLITEENERCMNLSEWTEKANLEMYIK